eukprot:scaffold8146_cov157-Skeletonema_menzelii.AAC.11
MENKAISAEKGRGSSSSQPRKSSFQSCSICSFKSYIALSSSSNYSRLINSGKKTTPFLPPSGGMLDASFVNIHSPTDANSSNKNDIDSILNDALSHNYSGRGGGNKGTSLQEASMKMAAYAEAAMEMIREAENIDNYSDAKDNGGEKYYCSVCIERIGQAIDVYTDHILDESTAYDEAASSEEERSLSIRKILSRIVNLNNADTNMIVSDEDEDSAIQWAIDSFHLELEALASAFHDQEEELRILQSLMRDQIIRSKTISEEEDRAMEALNKLEIDAHTFGEESHLVTKQCWDVMDWGEGMRSQMIGRYPTINNLRLAYRVNQKAGVGRKEICAAWNQAAQLITFTCGLHPSFSSANVRIIPLSYPCAKIVATFPEGQSVHNLGWETLDGEDVSPHVPSISITLFLALLSELSDHIISSSERNGAPHDTSSSPPFPMTTTSIDSVDVTCLGDSDTSSWSSVVFSISVNLRWLSQLVLPSDMRQIA